MQCRPDRSVSPDLEPGAWPGKHGYLGLDITNRLNAVPRKCEMVATVPTRGKRSVADFIDAVGMANHHRYKLIKQGQGLYGMDSGPFPLLLTSNLLEDGYKIQMQEPINQEWRKGHAVCPCGWSPT
jgi:hypothetical protein